MNKRKKKRETIYQKIRKTPSLAQSYPLYLAIGLIVLYFLLDYMMVNVQEELPVSLVVIFSCLGPGCLYSFYAADYQKGIYPAGGTDVPVFVKNQRKYVMRGWLAFSFWGIVFLSAGYILLPKIAPMLEQTYYWSQLVLFLFLAPIMEELIFRYLLYDRFFRRKWGWLPAFLLVSLFFVLCHPVTNTHALIIYYVPTILLFLVYHEFGLYGSIMMHMLYNLIAI